jgi:hypothetical protein
MSVSDEQIIHDTLRAFRKKRIETDWEKLDVVDKGRYDINRLHAARGAWHPATSLKTP